MAVDMRNQYCFHNEFKLKAAGKNPNQELLVDYFEGDIELSDQMLEAFLTEKYSDSPNYPLSRKYFKNCNENLKRLIISGLKRSSADIGLLSDLAFFHEFKNIFTAKAQRTQRFNYFLFSG